MYSKTPPLKDLCYNYNLLSHNAVNEQKSSCGLRLRDGATCIQLSGWRNTAPAKGGNHLTFPLQATTPTNNDDHLLLQKPGFLGLTARFGPSSTQNVARYCMSASSQISSITRAAFLQSPFVRVS